MAAPRAEIPLVILSESTPVSYVAGASVIVKVRETEATAIVYANAGASEAEIAQPLSSDSLGRITGWLPRGSYKFEITIPGKSAYTEYIDMVPGINGSIDTEFIATEAVTLAKIAASAKNPAAGTAGLRSLGTAATEAAAGNDGRLTNERVPTSGSVTTAKLENGAVTAVKIATGILPPTGAVTAFAGTTAPTGWLLCNGASKVKTEFEPLFALIEYKYGGTGANFNLPDLRGRTIFMVDGGAGRLDNAWAPSTLAAGGGNMWLQNHAHNAGGLSVYNQQRQAQQEISNNFNNYSGQGGFNAVSGWTGGSQTIIGTTEASGAGSSQNMPPYMVLNYIIKI
jgi:microcystin-dependent protein